MHFYALYLVYNTRTVVMDLCHFNKLKYGSLPNNVPLFFDDTSMKPFDTLSVSLVARAWATTSGYLVIRSKQGQQFGFQNNPWTMGYMISGLSQRTH